MDILSHFNIENEVNHKIQAYFNWSGGKDSTLALHKILEEGKFEVKYLLTTANLDHKRVAMHGVRLELMRQQAESLGIPLIVIEYSSSATMEEYENAMSKGIQPILDEGIRKAVFGDIFLEDLKEYRIKKLREIGVEAVFPLWKRDTRELINEFIELGYKTILVCTDNSKLDNSFIGKTIDHELISRLPETVDPCGENGEFHTFAYAGPIFKKEVKFEIGETVERKYEGKTSDGEEKNWGFLFVDLVPPI